MLPGAGVENPRMAVAIAAAMAAALAAAERALAAGEPPVGACVWRDGEVLATAHTAVIAAVPVVSSAVFFCPAACW
jgi:hypothetical protein